MKRFLSYGDRGGALPITMFLLLTTMAIGTFLLTRTSQDLRHSTMHRKIRTASNLANSVITDIMRQFSQSYQGDHYSSDALDRAAAGYGPGFSVITTSANVNQHFVAFEAEGRYGDDIDNPQHRKKISGVIKFISDLTTFGTMINGAFTTTGNATYQGKTWINGNWATTAQVTCLGGPVFVNGNISTSGGGTYFINGSLYRAGTRSGSVTITGADNAFMPSMTWPTIDRTYFDTYANVTVTADTTVRFSTAGTSGIVRVGGTNYTIPSTGLIVYGKNCTLTSSGTVRGHVTIASIRVSGAAGGIVTMDNHLRYATAGSTSLANTNDSFAALASDQINWNITNSDLFLSGVYFVDSVGTTGIFSTCTTCTDPGENRALRFFGTRNKGNSSSGFGTISYTYDTNLDTYPPPGLPEKPRLVTWHIK